MLCPFMQGVAVLRFVQPMKLRQGRDQFTFFAVPLGGYFDIFIVHSG